MNLFRLVNRYLKIKIKIEKIKIRYPKLKPKPYFPKTDI